MPVHEDVELSVISPVYQAEECIPELYRRLTQVLAGRGEPYELILVEDGGLDGSWQRIKGLAARDPRVRGLRLSRNFGQHLAIAAGLEVARGRQIVVMDCDLQDPPEAIPRLIAKADEGFDIVLARRRNRTGSWLRRWASKAFFLFMNKLSGGYVEDGVGAFSLISREVAGEYRKTADIHTHYLSALRWIGFEVAYIDVEQAHRFAGKSSYSLPKLVVHALDGVSSQSTRLLYLCIFGGFAFSLLSVVQILYLIYRKLIHSIGMAGWASLMAVLWFVGGAILLSLGIIGLYLGRVFEQVKDRPKFIVRERTDRAD